ncbi:MAG TPA: caspase family protein [Pseudonocardiaceae bacterium]|jgi:hypothetical protein|nr:caspase family protein [Pseudonocardiaceae bacterium]
MTGRRTALLIATDSYADPAFDGLNAPRQDATELAGLLGDPEIGGFTTTVLDNPTCNDARIALDELFGDAGRDDLLLFYVSGHGVKDEAGHLHLVLGDTRRNRLPATAISAQFVRDLIDHSPARRVVVWLDCCYAGAFPAGMVPKAEGTVDVVAQLNARSGRGCAVMTASTHIQYAYERGGPVEHGGGIPSSLFTNAIVAGLRTGAADLNADGEIDAAELYSYVYDQVRLVTPDQTPTRNDQLSGELYIARSKLGLGLPSTVDLQIRFALRSPHRFIRVGAVRQLGEMMRDGDLDALTALRLLAAGADQILADEATTILPPKPPPVAVSPPPRKRQTRPGSRPIRIGLGENSHGVYINFGTDPHFLIVGNDGFGKTNLLRVIADGIKAIYSVKQALYLVVDYRRHLVGAFEQERVLGFGVRSEQLRPMIADVVVAMRQRIEKPLEWVGPECFVIVDDYQLLAEDNPLTPLAELVERSAEIGLHLVIARSFDGTTDALGEDPLLRALDTAHASRLLGPRGQRPGNGLYVARDSDKEMPVQIAWSPTSGKAPAPQPGSSPNERPRSWRKELTDLDNKLASGEVSPDEYRRQRDELLARASEGPV